MRVLFCGDSHADWVTGGLERFDEVQRARRRTIEVAKQQEVDLYVDLGDTTDPDVQEALSHRAIAANVEAGLELREAGIASAWLVGNHDIIEDGRGSHTLMALRKAGLYVVDEPMVRSFFNEQAIVWLPYVHQSRRYDPVAFIRGIGRPLSSSGAEAKKVIVIGHMTKVIGLEVGSETNDMPRGRDMVFPVEECRKLAPQVLMVNGHYHRRHLHGDVITPGSLIRCTHGEEDFDPGFIVVDF